MNCEVTRLWLDAYIDGELELTRQLDLEAHLAASSTCKNGAEEAVNFGPLVRVNLPVYNAPPELKAQIQASLRKESGSQLEWVSHFRRPLG
jgi:anti-sigma factor RsiW